MKKLVVAMMVVVMMMVECTATAMADTTRQRNGKVVVMYDTIEHTHKEIVVDTIDGNRWIVYVDANTNLHKGNKVRATFNTKNTQTKKDDAIIKIVRR